MKKNTLNYGMILLVVLMILNRMQMRASNPAGFFYDTLITLPGIILGLSFHEFGHAFTAYKLGDSTPKIQGRVTLNPLAHVDPIGLVCLSFGGFGWGRPVMINVNVYKHPRRDRLMVAFAGVTMNALIVICLAFITRLVLHAAGNSALYSRSGAGIAFDILTQAIAINIMLMLFNLLPVPPLDGFNVVTEIFNLRSSSWYQKFYSAGGILLLVLIYFRLTSRILTPLVQGIYSFVMLHIVL